MIETKEQYEQWKSLVIGPAGAEGPTGLDAAVIETIEALREVARASDSLLGLIGALGGRHSLRDAGPDADHLEEKIDALPDWITDG